MRAAFGEGAPFGIQDAVGPPADEITVDALLAANDTESALTIRVANKAIVAFLVGSLSTLVGEELVRACWHSEDLRRSQRVFAEKPTSRFEES